MVLDDCAYVVVCELFAQINVHKACLIFLGLGMEYRICGLEVHERGIKVKSLLVFGLRDHVSIMPKLVHWAWTCIEATPVALTRFLVRGVELWSWCIFVSCDGVVLSLLPQLLPENEVHRSAIRICY